MTKNNASSLLARMRTAAFLGFLLGLLATAACASEPAPLLRVVGLSKTVELDAAAWARLPHTALESIEPHAKTSHRYAGVEMRELLQLVDAPLGPALRGPAHRTVVLVRARDGYSVVFALAEFDAAFSSRTLLVADRIDDQLLKENAAPLQLIVPGDQRGARWVRMIASLELVTLPASPP